MTAPTRPTGAPQGLTTPVTAGIGASPLRPDGTAKVKGEFAYGSDMWTDDMIWGVTLRSPHPYARIRSIDIGPALATPGVYAVLTHEDVPGSKFYGLEIVDQPVLAVDTVRYHGEPVALVAADHPEIARQAAKRIRVDYDVYEPITDAREALGHPRWNQVHNAPGKVSELSRERAVLHPQGNLVRHLKLRKGDPEPVADVVVVGEYEVGMQDQAFLGPESGLAVPAEDGGVELYVATQWLHVDQRQVCAALGLPPEKVRLTLAGVGGAFGGREDLSMHVHACMLALHTGKPVKMVYNREESFFGHVHRHPAVMRFEHGASRDGTLVYVKAQIYLDGGAYASSTPAVVGNAGTMGIGPYVVPNVQIDAYGAYTNNPPCGAMRGFGSVQAAFAHEAQMDKLAAELGMDPVDLRCRNAMTQGAEAPTGQVIDSAAPGRGAAAAGAGDAAAAGPQRGRRGGPAGPAGRRREHDPRRGRRARGRLRGGLQERRVLRGLRRLLHRPGAARGGGGRGGGDGAHRGGRGRPGAGHGRAADRAHRARRAAGHGAPQGHRGRQRRIDVGVPADLRHRRRGQGGLREGARARARGHPAADRALRAGPAARRRQGGLAGATASSATWPTCSATRSSRRRSSGTTARPSRSTRRPARASRTCSTRSRRIARWSTWTPSSA